MSIEQALAENTAAVKALTAALTAQGDVAPKATKATKAKETAAISDVQPVKQADATPASKPAETATPATASPELMKAIADQVTKLANTEGKGRSAVVAALKHFLPNEPAENVKIPTVIAAGKGDAFLAYVKSQNEPTAGAADFM